MALNPFFLQGSKGEQNLLRDLSNETIQIHGIEFIYMPRTLVNQKDVMREITSSKFDKSFPIEGARCLCVSSQVCVIFQGLLFLV